MPAIQLNQCWFVYTIPSYIFFYWRDNVAAMLDTSPYWISNLSVMVNLQNFE